MTDLIKPLEFFRDIESMEIPTAARLERGRNGIPAVTEHSRERPGMTPWQARRSGLTETSATFYLVWLGCAEMRDVVRHILVSVDPEEEPDREELARFWETAALGTMILDWRGRPLENSLSPAPFTFGVPELAAGKSMAGIFGDIGESVVKIMSDQFGEIVGAESGEKKDAEAGGGAFDDLVEDEAGKALGRVVTVHEYAADLPRLLGLTKGLLSKLGLEGVEPRVRITSKTVRFRKGAQVPRPDFSDAVMHSFYVGELGALAKRAETKKGLSPALEAYLSAPHPAGERSCLLADDAAMAEALRADKLPFARWPAPPAHSLSLAQQAAVGASVFDGPLTAINGPPGTGKTTLLRDVISQAVVERAERLAAAKSPHEVFEDLRLKDNRITAAKSRFVTKTGVIVASNNNAAVENISKELPGRHTIDMESFPDADYLSAVANDVAASFGEPNADCWGLLSLPLGNGDNIWRAFRGLDGHRSKDGKEPAPHGLFDALKALGPVKPTEWADARTAFQDARTEIEKALRPRFKSQDDLDLLNALEAELAALDADEEGLECEPPLNPDKDPTPEAEGVHGEEQPEDEASEAPRSSEQIKAELKKVRTRMKRRKLGFVVPDEAFFRKSAETRHLSSAWVDEELEVLRAQLFLAALKLHEIVLRANAFDLRSFVWTAKKVLRGETPVKSHELVKIWNTLFLICPVISTSLASVRRLPFVKEWIGHVLVDEAGQATPQSVAPLLQRAHRATIVGDPLQVEPVVKIPAPVIERLREDSGVDLRFSPSDGSAQTLADGVMKSGAWVSTGPNEKVWTGLPLRVHRRCAEPMFGIANRIAYDGQMVQGGSVDPDPMEGAGPSCWMDVRGSAGEGKVVREEMMLLERSLARFKNDWPQKHGQNASVCVISPFVQVEQAARDVAQKVFGRGAWKICPTGTVHRFQGREMDVVFLVLGSKPGAAGARSRAWAAARPNLLNVALTRARSRVYVIGNLDDWGGLSHFATLAQQLWAEDAIHRIEIDVPAA